MIDNYAVVMKDDRTLPAMFEGTRDEVTAWLKDKTNHLYLYEVYSPESNEYFEVVQAVEFAPETTEKYVPKFYQMDPETEDVFPNGSFLSNGMKVLLEDPAKRTKVDGDLEDWQEARALEDNRWCVVERLVVLGTQVTFVGVYEDGTKRTRRLEMSNSWIVKIDSIGDAANLATKRYSKAYGVAKAALEEQARRTVVTGVDQDLIEETTKKILEIL